MTPSGSQPTGTPFGLKHEAGTLTPPDALEVVLPVVEDALGDATVVDAEPPPPVVVLVASPPLSPVDEDAAGPTEDVKAVVAAAAV